MLVVFAFNMVGDGLQGRVGPAAEGDDLECPGGRRSRDEPLLRVENLKVQFNTERGVVAAVNDVSYDIYERRDRRTGRARAAAARP